MRLSGFTSRANGPGLRFAAPSPSPRAAQVVVTLGIGLGQIAMIGWGLWRMRLAAEERNEQLDIMAAAQRGQGQALRDQGQALRDIGQALRDQGQVSAELLRRTT